MSEPRLPFGHGITLNILASSISSATAVAEAYGSHVLIAVLARDFESPHAAANRASELMERGVAVSIGLGDGAAEQWDRALAAALLSKPAHLNQVFPASAMSQGLLADCGAETVVNALVQPSGTIGSVRVATGPRSQLTSGGEVSVASACDMLVETGVRSVKLHPIQGTAVLKELGAVAGAVADRSMMIEPTGGITPDNLEDILDTCLTEGAKYVMPHLYSSLLDPATGDVDMALLGRTVDTCVRVWGRYYR